MSQLYKQSIFQKYIDLHYDEPEHCKSVQKILENRRDLRINFLEVCESIAKKTVQFGVARDAVKCKWSAPGTVGMHLALLIAQHDLEYVTVKKAIMTDIIKKAKDAETKV